MTAGRPSSYDAAYCQLLVAHMGGGFSFESFASVAGVCVDTLYEWAKVHDEFSEAKKEGRAHQIFRWEQRLARLADDEMGNATAIVFALKNVAGWRDKTEVEHFGKGGGPVEVRALRDATMKLLADPEGHAAMKVIADKTGAVNTDE